MLEVSAHEKMERQTVSAPTSASSRSLRSRRVGSGSGIVLSKEKLKRMQDLISNDVDDAIPIDVTLKVSPNPPGMFPLTEDMNQYAMQIQHTWFDFRRYRFSRYRQMNRWSHRQADLTFSLVLGWRVRRLMRADRVRKHVEAIKNAWDVISDILLNSGAGEVIARNSDTTRIKGFLSGELPRVIGACRSGRNYTEVDRKDWPFLKTICKELVKELEIFYQTFFQKRTWKCFPVGHWVFDKVQKPHMTPHMTQKPQSRRHVLSDGVKEKNPRLHLSDISETTVIPGTFKRSSIRRHEQRSREVASAKVGKKGAINPFVGSRGGSLKPHRLSPQTLHGSSSSVNLVGALEAKVFPKESEDDYDSDSDTGDATPHVVCDEVEESTDSTSSEELGETSLSCDINAYDNRVCIPVDYMKVLEESIVAEDGYRTSELKDRTRHENTSNSPQPQVGEKVKPAISITEASTDLEESFASPNNTNVRQVSTLKCSAAGRQKKSEKIDYNISRRLEPGGKTKKNVSITKGRLESSRSPSTSHAPVQRCRSIDNAHIQLYIAGADNLFPARRGSASRGCEKVVADRKPGLQVSMYLPSASAHGPTSSAKVPSSHQESSSPSSLSSPSPSVKRVYNTRRDFAEATLNPQWRAAFTIPLPCYKCHMIQPIDPINTMEATRNNELMTPTSSTSSSTRTQERSGNRIGDMKKNSAAVTDEMASLQRCKGLMDYWAGGYIVVKVVDGERFNEDIHLGEFTILMSSFFMPSNGRERLEIGGAYPLTKPKCSHRVSGNIYLQAFVHLPTVQYLDASLNIQSPIPCINQNQRTDPSPHPHPSPSPNDLPLQRPHTADVASVLRKGPTFSDSPARTELFHPGKKVFKLPFESKSASGRLAQIDDLNRCLNSLTELQKSISLQSTICDDAKLGKKKRQTLSISEIENNNRNVKAKDVSKKALQDSKGGAPLSPLIESGGSFASSFVSSEMSPLLHSPTYTPPKYKCAPGSSEMRRKKDQKGKGRYAGEVAPLREHCPSSAKRLTPGHGIHGSHGGMDSRCAGASRGNNPIPNPNDMPNPRGTCSISGAGTPISTIRTDASAAARTQPLPFPEVQYDEDMMLFPLRSPRARVSQRIASECVLDKEFGSDIMGSANDKVDEFGDHTHS